MIIEIWEFGGKRVRVDVVLVREHVVLVGPFVLADFFWECMRLWVE